MAKRRNTESIVATSTRRAGNQREKSRNARNTVRVVLLLFTASIAILVLLSRKLDVDVEPEDMQSIETSVTSLQGADDKDTLRNERQKQQERTIRDPTTFGGSWSLVKHFSKTYDIEGLYAHLKHYFDSNQRAFDPSKRKTRVMAMHHGAGFDKTTRHKLLHDLEQFDFFLRTDLVGLQPHGRELFGKIIPAAYRETLARLDQASKTGDFDEQNDFYRFGSLDAAITSYYNRALFLPDLPQVQRPFLTQRDWTEVESQWFGEDVSYPHPGIMVIDNVLSPAAMERVRNYLLLGTFWYESKTPRYGRYIGAYINDGMYDPMLSEIAFELHRAMPRVMKDHHLKEMWSYKYESSLDSREERTGIHIHADDAMINCNLWVTPDEANLDESSGGLVIYTIKPSSELDRDFEKFNSNWEYVDEHLLRPSGYANVTIPYKQNRAVIFDSFLFHKSQPHRFKAGYENRRINLTFLYGDKQSKDIGPEKRNEL